MENQKDLNTLIVSYVKTKKCSKCGRVAVLGKKDITLEQLMASEFNNNMYQDIFKDKFFEGMDTFTTTTSTYDNNDRSTSGSTSRKTGKKRRVVARYTSIASGIVRNRRRW